ncbi:MAG: hypothetical protein OXC44_03275 [Proteobacteria bacterium]|nr:hypothetical protein [Pseudomonadota bacterium]
MAYCDHIRDDQGRALKASKGDFGGPLVKSVNKLYLCGCRCTDVALPDTESKLLGHQYTNYGSYLNLVNTVAYLDWVVITKSSMVVGSHSYQDCSQKLVKNGNILTLP